MLILCAVFVFDAALMLQEIALVSLSNSQDTNASEECESDSKEVFVDMPVEIRREMERKLLQDIEETRERLSSLQRTLESNAVRDISRENELASAPIHNRSKSSGAKKSESDWEGKRSYSVSVSDRI